MPTQLEQMNIRAFPAIRDSTEFVNVSGQGLPLHVYRKIHPALKDFKEITSYVAGKISKGKTKEKEKSKN